MNLIGPGQPLRDVGLQRVQRLVIDVDPPRQQARRKTAGGIPYAAASAGVG